MEDFEFEEALIVLKNQRKVTRSGWNAPGQWVAMQVPDANSKMGCRYLYLHNAQGKLVPWVPSQGDLFATDWKEHKE